MRMEIDSLIVNGPHNGAPLYISGAPLANAGSAVVLVHGRGADAADMLSVADELDLPATAWLAPEAVGSQWYPHRFLVPSAANQPWLDSALEVVGAAVKAAADGGIPVDQIFLLGFSQGACLALEWSARNGRKLGGVFGLSGGLIGADAELDAHSGDLGGMPVFLGCSDVDEHIPAARVEHTGRVFNRLGADVTLRLYAGMGHAINRDELAFIQETISGR